MSDIEIRSLNGHKLVDENARLEIEEIKMNGAGGGGRIARNWSRSRNF